MSINTDYSYYDSSSYYTRQTHKKDKEKLDVMSLLDKNNDKSLNADELSSFAADFNEKTGQSLDLSSIMSTYDANGDGELDESEQEAINKEKAIEKLMASGRPQLMRMMDGPPPSPLSDIDTDGDGSLNSDELSELLGKINEITGGSLDSETALQKYDTDGDGVLSQTEQAEMMKDMAPPPKPQGASSDDDEKIRERIEELQKLMEERDAKKEEENTITENAVTKAEAMKQALLRRITEGINNYEKSFWYVDAAE